MWNRRIELWVYVDQVYAYLDRIRINAKLCHDLFHMLCLKPDHVLQTVLTGTHM